MRNRGASGGGTLWSGAPQLLQISCGVPWTRSQWPRAGHSGVKHCTVQPGRYCILFPHSQHDPAEIERKAPTSVKNGKRPVKLAGLCAGASSVSRKICTISRGAVPKRIRGYPRQKFAQAIYLSLSEVGALTGGAAGGGF
jgi:hypothetical protein